MPEEEVPEEELDNGQMMSRGDVNELIAGAQSKWNSIADSTNATLQSSLDKTKDQLKRLEDEREAGLVATKTQDEQVAYWKKRATEPELEPADSDAERSKIRQALVESTGLSLEEVETQLKDVPDNWGDVVPAVLKLNSDAIRKQVEEDAAKPPEPTLVPTALATGGSGGPVGSTRIGNLKTKAEIEAAHAEGQINNQEAKELFKNNRIRF